MKNRPWDPPFCSSADSYSRLPSLRARPCYWLLDCSDFDEFWLRFA